MTDYFIATGWKNAPEEVYPYILANTQYLTSDARVRSKTLMVDSDIKNQEETNANVIERAEAFKADIVVAKDYLQNPKTTIISVIDFLSIAEDRDWEACIPLQPNNNWDYTECFEALKDEGDFFGIGATVMIRSKAMKYEVLKPIVDLLRKHDKEIHIFGLWPGPILQKGKVQRIWELLRSGDIRSIDSMNAETYSVTGKFMNLDNELITKADTYKMEKSKTNGQLSTPYHHAWAAAMGYAVQSALNRKDLLVGQKTLDGYVYEPRPKSINFNELRPTND